MLALLLAAALLLPAAPALAAAPTALKSANVEWVGAIDAPDGVSAAFVGTHMYLSTFRGLEVYDVSDPAAPAKVGQLDLPLFQNEDVSTNGEILLISRDAVLGLSRLYVVDISAPTQPTVMSTLDTSDYSDPYGSIGHTASCIDDCRYAWLAGWSDGIDVVDLRDPARPRFASPRKVRMPAAACSGGGRRAVCDGTHDVQVDGSGLAWVAGIGGTAAYDVSDPVHPRRRFRTNRSGRSRALEGRDVPPDGSSYNDFIHHNSLRRGDTVLITEEDFRPGCKHPGSFQTWRIGRGHKLRPLDKWEVEPDPARAVYCSAHYFDDSDGLVVQGWYEAGARFIDWSHPRNLRQAGYWIPFRGNVTNAYWAPTDPERELAYVVDEQRGIDIVRFDRSAPAVSRRPPRQARNSGIRSRPDLAANIDNGLGRVRPGSRVSYRVRFANRSRKPTPAGNAIVELGAGLSYAAGGATARTIRVPALARKETATRRLKVRIATDAPPVVEASVVANVADGDPANDFGVVRNPTRRGGARAAGAARLYCMLGAR